jgi:MFS family permease
MSSPTAEPVAVALRPYQRFLHVNRFWTLWLSTAVSNLADGIFKLALPLLAVHLTDSPSLIAGVALAARLPWLLFALFAGVLVDRFDRRRIMIGANVLRVIILTGMVASIALDGISLVLIYVAALVLGVAETLADTAGSTVLPSIVEAKNLESANARLVGVTTITNEFIGPPLGGLLAAASLALAFATSSVLYLVAALAIVLLSGSFRPAPRSQPSHITADIMAGLRFVWHDRLLRALVIIVAVMNLGWSAWASIMVLYVVAPGPVGLSEVGYGLMLTSIGIGGVVGAIIAVPLVKRFGRRWAIGADIVGTFTMLALPAFTANPWAIGAAAVIGGIGGTMWSIVVSSIRQQAVPDDMMGRVSSVFRLFGYGALPLGSALAGIVAETVSLPAVFALCAALTLLLLIPFFQVITPQTLNARLAAVRER